jgi:hypothetical protein
MIPVRSERGIAVVYKSSRTDDPFERNDSTLCVRATSMSVPPGKVLGTSTTHMNDGATLIFRASKQGCDACDLKSRCCPNSRACKIPRSIHQGGRYRPRYIPL